MTKIAKVPHQIGVFLGALGGFFGFLLITEVLVQARPPLLMYHHSCESAGWFACGLRNIGFFSLAGIAAGTAGAAVAWRTKRTLLPVTLALVGGSLFVAISALAGEPILNMQILSNYAGSPSWVTVPVPIVLAGLTVFFLVRRASQT